MLTLIVVLKALAEVAGLALLGQGILFLLAGASREQNVFYRVIQTITSPIIRFTRLITPRFVSDRHIGLAAFFPALVLGIFWKRASNWGAILGMAAGLGITFYYMATTQPWLRSLFGVTSPIADNMWFGINPISAGVFGVPLGFAVIIIVSLFTAEPSKKVQELIEHVRYPHLKGSAARSQ